MHITSQHLLHGIINGLNNREHSDLKIDFSERHHPFEGCFNFRDIGGYRGIDGRPVRWGRYFRAARQDRMTPADLENAAELSIRTQIDLRRSDEVHNQGRGPLENIGTRYEWHPVIPDGGSEQLDKTVGKGISGERYLAYLDFDPTSWRRIFALLADADRHPLLVHCTSGKDRTGVTTAFLLSVLGVDRDVIEADYLLTNIDRDRYADFLEQGTGFPPGRSRASVIHSAGVPEDAMRVFLDGIERKYGGPLHYLRSVGIDDDQQNAIREVMLDS